MDNDLKTQLDRIERKLSMLMQERKKGGWVTAPVVAKLTGWDKYGLYKARQNGYVQYKKQDGKFLYDVESIHPIHFKKEQV